LNLRIVEMNPPSPLFNSATGSVASPRSPFRIDIAPQSRLEVLLPQSDVINSSLSSHPKQCMVEGISTEGTSLPSSPRGDQHSLSPNLPKSNTMGDSSVKYYRYDSLVKLEKPFSPPVRRLLEITELPFMIMWVYFTYWIIIVSLCASQVRNTVWISAAIAGLLVGIGLNANAYRMIIEHGVIDYGVVIRFFLIPFGVSSLSGMTNSLREQFLLVFPRDPFELAVSICIPAVVISCLVIVRLTLLWKLRIRMTLRVLLLNGSLTDRCRGSEDKDYVSCS